MKAKARVDAVIGVVQSQEKEFKYLFFGWHPAVLALRLRQMNAAAGR